MLQLSTLPLFKDDRVHRAEKLRPMAQLLLRVDLGVIFIYNGYPKFFGRRLEHIDEMVHINIFLRTSYTLPAFWNWVEE